MTYYVGKKITDSVRVTARSIWAGMLHINTHDSLVINLREKIPLDG